ncbi:SWI/SNF complex subunit SWI3B isoform X2 [Hevea brasiliensis]|uniref:SWI/SNF complex subunit SWI3B isoform X2 n=1 Tax=Hevea brasiliensis TaxID=3981 RepID=UPI000B78D406|nr:SWI/SNF complex subunit SWI3B isoform X2 [Hevea brasiliensis]
MASAPSSLIDPSTATPPSLKPKLHQPSLAPTTPSSLKPEFPTPSTATHRPPLVPPSSDADIVHIPSYSRWFSWNNIHECEVRFLPEFFDSRSPSKNPRVYMYYRNSIIKYFRRNPSGKITFTEVRKTLVGDVGSIRRVFDFLEAWGLINYSPSALNKPLKWEDKDSKSTSQSGADGGTSADSTPPKRDTSKRLCSGCQSVCTIACFVCDKYDLTLCARCYVRGNYRVGVSSSDFRRVEISEEIRTEWTEKETLQLLEAVAHYGDDWKKVALHVPGRSEKDCVSHFIKLPFGEEFAGYANLGELDNKHHKIKDCTYSECGSESIGSPSANKRMHLTPLADASNPIMAQAAFLSALVGTEVAEAAAQAAVAALTEVEYVTSKGGVGSLFSNARQQGAGVGSNVNALERASLDANPLPEKEQQDAEKAISRIIEVQMKEIQDKIVRFEEMDLLMEKEWQQLEQIKNLLFVDQLSLLFHKKSTPKTGERMEDNQ